MKIKCKVCRKDTIINELDYKPGEKVIVECPRCGNELEATIPLRDEATPSPNQGVGAKSSEENNKIEVNNKPNNQEDLKAVWYGDGRGKGSESIQAENSKPIKVETTARAPIDSQSSKSNNSYQASSSHASKIVESGINVRMQSQKKESSLAKFVLIGLGILIAVGIGMCLSKGEADSNTSTNLAEDNEIVAETVEERVDPFYDLLNHPERELRWEDIKDLDKSQLRILRNSYFARHGYIFNDPELTKFFNQFDWYHPYTKDVIHNFSQIEKHNVELIRSYENI